MAATGRMSGSTLVPAEPGSSAAAALKDHPSPKNLEMCVDAILDVTNADDIVLDPFLARPQH